LSKNVAVFVDVANLYYSARGQEVDVDYVALLKAATKGRDLIRAYAYSGLDPENENQRKFIDFLAKNGYRVVHKDIRKFGDGRVKANLDIELVVDLFRLRDRMDIAVIVSGDGDFAPAIRALQDEGVRCEVISFRPNTSSDLIAVADEFIDIMKVIGIGRERTEKTPRGMSAPEMPAKEVVPEFGFREASPSVAAAALAALRGGESAGGTARGRRGGRRDEATGVSREAVAAPEPAAAREAAANGDAGNGSAVGLEAERRRRRRRGGRGRGRGRRADGEAALEGDARIEGGLAAGAPAEIAWQELDDLSQLEGLDEEREYTFEEADEATLAELGLLDRDHAGKAPATDEAAASHAEVDGEAAVAEGKPEKTPRRRTTRRRATAEPAEAVESVGPGSAAEAGEAPGAGQGAEAGQAGEAGAASPRRRGRRAAPAGAEGGSGRTSRARTPRRRSPAAAGSDSEGEAQPTARRGGRRSGSRTRKSEESAAGVQEPAEQDRAASDAPDGESTADPDKPQGIWQRFRSARNS
jgi:uncharacterized LabA/DUF88 family protein